VQNFLRRQLERWGFTVEAVADGRLAVQRHLELLQQGSPFDLMIMDLTIPGGMGGRQAMAAILEHDPDARAIVVSGYCDDPTMARFREAGFRAALTKPFALAELAHAIRTAIRRR
ncbi:MAG: response regulator, partial [Planctomycetes bacterium]|nr:response regulator [Planctomycetota bacterium]